MEFPLVELVKRYSIPAIEQVVIASVIETWHNPIRVVMVDGVDVSEAWYGRDPKPTLIPESVQIPMSEVARLAAG
ncbi:hypothetical protein [Streptomyces agglomeratus]|uniref:hypothetical protein n=1 Tax=Streptomyces agglomeratus TaxID=285458 RepID=UPI000854C1B6|nr:hypothetical protein [Streptomyces agglomeratus]OEJ36289.1 hypothetical protein BGK72_38675 [Streptomyces agglomeratus]